VYKTLHRTFAAFAQELQQRLSVLSVHAQLINDMYTALWFCAWLLTVQFPIELPLKEQLTPAELHDLLLIATNLRNPCVACNLVEYNRRYQLLLYANSDLALNSSSSSSGSRSSSSGSSSNSSSSSISQLVEHCITTAFVRGHWRLGQLLAGTPAAKQLRPQQLTQLLLMYFRFEQPSLQPGPNANNPEVFVVDHRANCFYALCALPAACSISPSSVASLVRTAVHLRMFARARRLCQLPAAQDMPWQQLAELLLLLLTCDAGDDEWQRDEVTQHAIDLRAATQLPPGAAKDMLSWMLDRVKAFTCGVQCTSLRLWAIS
jgi:hypothetical protein